MMMNGKDDVLSAKGKAAMMRPASEASPFYGFGWFVDSGKGAVYHTGNSVGYETLATMVPAEKKGVVVLVNAGSGIGFGETIQLRNGIAARALGLDYDGEGPVVAESFVHLFGAPAGHVPAQHDLGMASPRRTTRQVWLLRPVQFVVPVAHHAGHGLGRFRPHAEPARRSFGTLNLFQPDLGLVLIAIPVTGVLWAVFRLGVAYSGKSVRAWPRESLS